jgi:Ca2+/Na+ antiporter
LYLIKKPREREGHSPRWAAEPEIMMMMMMMMMIIIIIIIYPLNVSNRLTIHHQEAIAVYTAYSVYHVEADA